MLAQVMLSGNPRDMAIYMHQPTWAGQQEPRASGPFSEREKHKNVLNSKWENITTITKVGCPKKTEERGWTLLTRDGIEAVLAAHSQVGAVFQSKEEGSRATTPESGVSSAWIWA